jgi:NADH dehydrogenase
MRIFVAGGTGFVGGNLCRSLREAGHEVRLLVHRRHDNLADGIEQVEGDATDLQSFVSGVSGCDAVINLIGIIREFPGRGITFEKLHVEATRNMLAAARQAGIGRYLQMSALGTRPNAVSGYHKTKWRAEELVRESGLDWTIFRPSLIFGSGDAFVNMLAELIRNLPFVPVIGDGKYRMQPIAATDVARCFSMALDIPATVGQTYELCGVDRFNYLEMLDTVGRVLGKKSVMKIKNPLLIMKLITPILQQFPFYPITMDQIQMLTEENICDGTWRSTFGFDATRFEAGIASYLKA